MKNIKNKSYFKLLHILKWIEKSTDQQYIISEAIEKK